MVKPKTHKNLKLKFNMNITLLPSPNHKLILHQNYHTYPAFCTMNFIWFLHIPLSFVSFWNSIYTFTIQISQVIWLLSDHTWSSEANTLFLLHRSKLTPTEYVHHQFNHDPKLHHHHQLSQASSILGSK